jgi:hypothetical protein
LLLFFRAGYRLFRTSDDVFLSSLGLGFSSLIVCAAIVNIFGDRWMYIQVDSNLWILLGCVVSASSLAAVRLQQPAPEADALSVMTLEAHALITQDSHQDGHQDDGDEPSIAHTPAALVNRSGDDLKLTFS